MDQITKIIGTDSGIASENKDHYLQAWKIEDNKGKVKLSLCLAD
jgi:hypothetical protein